MTAQPSWFEHVDLMQVLIGVLFCIVTFFFVRTLKGLDRNQDLLFSKHNKLEEKHNILATVVAELKGEHKARTAALSHCEVKQ